MRDALVLRVRRAEILFQRFALDVLNQSPADVRVRENRDREVALRDKLEQQNVSAERAAMSEGANGPDVSHVPRDADRVIGALLPCLRGAHQLERFLLEHALAGGGRSIAQVKARI